MWFRKKQKEIVKSVSKSASTAEVIAEIHNSFETAADRLLTEAKEVVASIQINEKASRLSSLGFRIAKGVEENEELKAKVRMNKELSDIILYFQQTYPLYKFITLTEIETICKKYNLVFGEISLYKGDVPDKNLLEIEKFQKGSFLKVEDKKYTHAWDIFSTAREISYTTYQSYRKSDSKDKGWTREDRDYYICAPLSDMKVEEKHIFNGWKIEIPDPIVLFPVRGGYLIVSKWGPEASDELVVNEKMN